VRNCRDTKLDANLFGPSEVRGLTRVCSRHALRLAEACRVSHLPDDHNHADDDESQHRPGSKRQISTPWPLTEKTNFLLYQLPHIHHPCPFSVGKGYAVPNVSTRAVVYTGTSWLATAPPDLDQTTPNYQTQLFSQRIPKLLPISGLCFHNPDNAKNQEMQRLKSRVRQQAHIVSKGRG